MKRSLNGWILATGVIFSMGALSCQNQDADLNTNIPQGEKIEVTLNASIDGAETRALTHDGKIMKFTWTKDVDKVEVVNAETGVHLGTLTVSGTSNEGRSCSFKGTITQQTGDNIKLNYFFLGEEGELNLIDGYKADDTQFSFASQPGTHDSMDDYDILTGSKTYQGSVSKNLGTVLFQRYISFGKFILKTENNDGTLSDFDTQSQPITISSVDEGLLNNGIKLLVKVGDTGTLANNYELTKGDITVNSTSNEFYVNLIPSNLNGKGLKFTCVVNEVEFVGTVGESTNLNITENTLITRDGNAVPVIMKRADGSDDRFDLKVKGYKNDGTDGVVEGKSINSTLPYTYTLDGNLTKPTRDGYIFMGWGSANNSTVDDALTEITFNNREETTKYVYAIWAESYTCRFEDEQGKTLKEETRLLTEEITADDCPNAPEPSNQYTEFAGWKVKGSDDSTASKTGPWSPTNGTKELVLVPVYTPIQYTLKVIGKYNDGTTDTTKDKEQTITGVTIPSEHQLSLEEPTRQDYVFKGWSLTSDGKTAVTKVTFNDNENVTVYAIWEKEPEAAVNAGGYKPGSWNQ